MRVFVTGGSGFLGSQLIQNLESHEVLVLSRHPPKKEVGANCKWLQGEIACPGEWEADLVQFDPHVCVHLAWEGLPSYTKKTSKRNVELSRLLIQTLKKTETKRLVVAGSCWEYGDLVGQLDEASTLAPESYFAKAKIETHHEFEKYSDSAGVSLVWARIFFSYGSGQRRSSLLPLVFDALKREEVPEIRSPEVFQDFIHTSDIASALSSLIAANRIEGVFNIGSGTITSVSEFVNIVAASCGSSFRLELPKSLYGFWASIEKIKLSTGWIPKVSLEQGILKTLKEMEVSHLV